MSHLFKIKWYFRTEHKTVSSIEELKALVLKEGNPIIIRYCPDEKENPWVLEVYDAYIE